MAQVRGLAHMSSIIGPEESRQKEAILTDLNYNFRLGRLTDLSDGF